MKLLLVGFLCVMLVSACAPQKGGETRTAQPPAALTPTAPAANPTIPTSSTEGEAQQTPPPGGISFEEDQRINPPMPRELRASLTGEGILLEWQPPELVSGLHAYSDTPRFYRIYRRTGDGRAEPVGTSEDLSYLDRTAQPGVQYAYMVSAVYDRGLEGTRTDAVQAPVR